MEVESDTDAYYIYMEMDAVYELRLGVAPPPPRSPIWDPMPSQLEMAPSPISGSMAHAVCVCVCVCVCVSTRPVGANALLPMRAARYE